MTPRITRLLWEANKDGTGFEEVYQRLYDESRTGVIPQQQFQAFHDMVAGMFHTMRLPDCHAKPSAKSLKNHVVLRMFSHSLFRYWKENLFSLLGFAMASISPNRWTKRVHHAAYFG